MHDPDHIIDAAESLAVCAGPAAVTTRAVGAAARVSNGAIYHSFGSRGALLGRTWLRAARRFLSVHTELVDSALDNDSGIAAVVAAAEAPAVFAQRFPQSSRLLVGVHRHQLLDDDLTADVAGELAALDRVLVGLMIRLSTNLWGRKDSRAVDTITACIVDLPTAMLLSRNRINDPTAREHLKVAVRAVLEVGPAPRRSTEKEILNDHQS
jgi:AcrR family transcriptional regulator